MKILSKGKLSWKKHAILTSETQPQNIGTKNFMALTTNQKYHYDVFFKRYVHSEFIFENRMEKFPVLTEIFHFEASNMHPFPAKITPI